MKEATKKDKNSVNYELANVSPMCYSTFNNDNRRAKMIADKKIAQWKQDALNDGWVEVGPIWGGSDTDFSVKMTKDDIVVHLVDRQIGRGDKITRNAQISGWFNNGFQAIAEMPDTYDMNEIEKQRKFCHFCEKISDNDLHYIGFAGAVCDECDTKELRSEIEFEGFYN